MLATHVHSYNKRTKQLVAGRQVAYGICSICGTKRRLEYNRTTYADFVAIYKGNVSDALLYAFNQWQAKGSRSRMKDLLCFYFTGARLSDIESGVAMSYKKIGQEIRIDIWIGREDDAFNYSVPIFDENEMMLYRYCFNEWLDEDCVIDIKEVTLRYQLDHVFASLLKEKIEFNTAVNPTAIRHLRMFSLQKDYNIDERSIYSIMRLKKFDYAFRIDRAKEASKLKHLPSVKVTQEMM